MCSTPSTLRLYLLLLIHSHFLNLTDIIEGNKEIKEVEGAHLQQFLQIFIFVPKKAMK